MRNKKKQAIEKSHKGYFYCLNLLGLINNPDFQLIYYCWQYAPDLLADNTAQV